MKILGIETSCDETSVAVVENGWRVLENVIASQIPLHAKTGGVVPEVAAREHALKIVPVLEKVFAKIPLAKIDAIAVTVGPGLLSSLLMGNVAANTLNLVFNKPIIPVHHIEGHIYANFLDRKVAPGFPAAVLTVSGGHNEIILWKNHGEYEFLGETLDDAAGEAFDKVARMLGLGYPGGPEIERAAKLGDPTKYPLPRSYLTPKVNYNFSFSGLKAAVNRLVAEHKPKLKTNAAKKKFANDVAASFQESVIEVLSAKIVEAASRHNAKEIHLTGGVSANKALRKAIEKRLIFLPGQENIFRHPEKMIYCTDNAAMTAACGYFKFKKLGKKAFLKNRPSLPDPNWGFKNW